LTFTEAVIQGLIQGFTEFLPVSSSGHLSKFQYLTGDSGEAGALLSIALHFGTLVAVIIAFRQTIGRLIAAFFRSIYDLLTGQIAQRSLAQERAMLWLLIVSLVPLGLTFVLRDFYQRFSSDSDIIVEGVCLMGTGTLLYLADSCIKGARPPGICAFGTLWPSVWFRRCWRLCPACPAQVPPWPSAFFWGWSEATPFPSLLLWASPPYWPPFCFPQRIFFQPAPP
jgi:undecaprenyl-diphosphatase